MSFRTLRYLGIALALATCSPRHPQLPPRQPRQMAKLVEHLKCASSSVDESVHVTGPYWYGYYYFGGEFNQNASNTRFDLRYYETEGTVDTELGEGHITHDVSSDGIDIFEFDPIKKARRLELYAKFLEWATPLLERVCAENPFAREVRDVGLYDTAINKTTKPTLVYFYADWCFPCHIFETRGGLRVFMAKNRDEYDLVRVNIGQQQPFSVGPDWEELLKNRYGLGIAVPLVVFLDRHHVFKGSHLGNDRSFIEDVREHLGEVKW